MNDIDDILRAFGGSPFGSIANDPFLLGLFGGSQFSFVDKADFEVRTLPPRDRVSRERFDDAMSAVFSELSEIEKLPESVLDEIRDSINFRECFCGNCIHNFKLVDEKEWMDPIAKAKKAVAKAKPKDGSALEALDGLESVLKSIKSYDFEANQPKGRVLSFDIKGFVSSNVDKLEADIRTAVLPLIVRHINDTAKDRGYVLKQDSDGNLFFVDPDVDEKKPVMVLEYGDKLSQLNNAAGLKEVIAEL